MSKYIIDTGDYLFTTDGVLVVGFDCDNKPATFYNSLDNLEELNSDYINEHYGELQDEAYQRGHDDGYEAGCATAFKPVSDAEYQRGLDEAMNAFKKLYSCGWERDWKAMGFEFDEGEWSTSFEFIIGHYTAAEIVEKVKAYEEKELHVGDEVKWNSDVIIMTGFYEVGGFNWCDGISQDGRAFHVLAENVRKTGKHYDIASILEAMKS